MREICFDTETTGFNYMSGDRIVEIGALELINHIPTGREFHEYINPERDIPQAVVEVHGLTNEFLADKPVFADIAEKWINFVGEDGILVAHNASFDINFINMELKKCGLPEYDISKAVDTLEIARKKFPGAHNKLDDLCKRFGIDNSSRTLHGALLDSQLLAEVYLQLLGGNEPGIDFLSNEKENYKIYNKEKINIIERHFVLSEEECSEHRSFLEKNIKNSLWLSDEISKENE